MKVIKPGKLGVLTRCFEHERRFYMGVSALMFVPLRGEPTLLSEVGMWTYVGKRLGKDAVLDVGIPKARGEFVIAASAYPPGGQAQSACAVRARVGEREKILHVFGDRYWRSTAASEAQPFTVMPIDWAHAFGGPSFADNPLGKGHDEVELEGARVRWLPNVELPRERVDSPRSRPTPAGFMPIDISWPQRMRLAGTHDQHWLDNLFPGFARDIDWGIFNIAPRDQQIEGFWRGDEAFEFEHLHPEQALLAGTLPPYVARCFVSRAGKGPERLDEVGLALQTLWFFPDADKAILIFQGSTRVREEDAADILHLVLAAEQRGQVRTLAHYTAALAARLDPEKGAVAALRERELLPETLAPAALEDFPEDRELSANEGLLQQNFHRRAVKEAEQSRAFVASFGLDPDIHGPAIPTPPAPPPSPEELPDLMEKLLAEAKQVEQTERATMAQKQAEVRKLVDELGIEGFDGEALRREQEQTPVGPPTFTADGQRALLATIAAESRAQGTVIDEIEEMIVDEQLYARWQDAERRLRDAYRLTAHLQSPAPRMPDDMRAACRARVREALAKGESFAQLNLTGADLSRMDLRGANLSQAFLESARLDGADLRGADLTNAVLAHGSLRSVELAGATLRGANLGKANLEAANLEAAELGEAILVEAELGEAVLRGAKLVGADLSRARFRTTDARGIDATGINSIDSDLRGLDLADATLTRANFLRAELERVNFAGAKLDSCTFLACKARAANFYGASLANARFIERCELDEAVFTEAQMPACNLRGASLVGADLRRATLDDADLSETNLHGAKLYQVVARRARFDKADLGEGELMSGNFMHASFARATISGADLRGANLYGADMARVRTDARVQLDQALLTKVRVNPRWNPATDDVDQP